MPSITTIKNERLAISVDSHGAELVSAKTADGTERIWQGAPGFWAQHSPLLFPIVGALRGNRYTYAGREYEMPKHGFGKLSEFELEVLSGDSATFLLKSDDRTRAMYPFDFELRITYTLKGSALEVAYTVDNLTDGEMYLSIGAHEGYACPGGIENYTVVFDEEETLSTHGVNGDTGLILDTATPVMEKSRELKIRNSYFEIDALVFLDHKSRALALRDDRTGELTRVEFPGFDTLLIWTQPGAEFLCIEPWSGAPDFESKITGFEEKPLINRVERGAQFKRTHTITFGAK